MSTALITGVTGQDGTYLAELLVARGQRVVGVARSVKAGTASTTFEVVTGDVEDAAFVEHLVAAHAPNEIYHLAGQTSVGRSFAEPSATFRSVALGTSNVLEAVRKAAPRARVLVASSGEVFGDRRGEPARESTPYAPRSPYAAAKAAASQLATSYRVAFGLHVSLAYFYNHESPRRPESFVTTKIVRTACRIARGDAMRLELGDTSVVRDWGWAPEYVEAARRVLELDVPEDFVIATGVSCSLDDFVEHVFSNLGLTASDHVQKNLALLRPAEIPAMHADPSHAAERLGWRATVHVGEVAQRLVAAELGELDARR